MPHRDRTIGRPDAEGRWGRAAATGAVAGGAAFLVSGAILTAGARIMARMPLVPHGRRRDDATIRAVTRDRVHLDATRETSRPGVLALRQAGGAVHLRVGDVVSRPTPTTVARTVLAVDVEDAGARPDIGPAGTHGYFWAGDPTSAHGLDHEEILIDSPVGQMPAWLVPPGRLRADARPSDPGTWAILVHGHGAERAEALRLIPLLHALGLTSLAITYRNDVGAPASADRMHHLGADEWEDAEAAIETALSRGARRIVLVGWSMGGGVVLRTSVLSEHRGEIAAVVLDSPAVDWHDILDHHARMLRAPRAMRALAVWMMRSPWGARAVRLHEPIVLAQLTPEFHALRLAHPVLLVHAEDDATVPPGPSARLAALAPGAVHHVLFPRATHTREWNTDPERYERLIAVFLTETLGLGLDVDALDLPVRDPASTQSATASRRT